MSSREEARVLEKLAIEEEAGKKMLRNSNSRNCAGERVVTAE